MPAYNAFADKETIRRAISLMVIDTSEFAGRLRTFLVFQKKKDYSDKTKKEYSSLFLNFFRSFCVLFFSTNSYLKDAHKKEIQNIEYTILNCEISQIKPNKFLQDYLIYLKVLEKSGLIELGRKLNKDAVYQGG